MVPAAYSLFAGTVPASYSLFAVTVPAYNLIHLVLAKIGIKILMICRNIQKVTNSCLILELNLNQSVNFRNCLTLSYMACRDDIIVGDQNDQELTFYAVDIKSHCF